MAIDVSVIIPFYNVEPFVERCVHSLMKQTLQNVEFIFVNDASPDSSERIIREVSSLYNRNVVILTHEVNKGLPAARNTGMSQATGKYIYHCDSDDYLELNMLEKLFLAAEREGADIAYCDFYLDFGNKRSYMTNPDYSNACKMVMDGFLAGKMKYNVWNKFIRRSLFTKSGIIFPKGHSMGEDMTIIMLSTQAEKVVYVKEALYHYIKSNGSAFTKTFSQKHIDDIQFNATRVVLFLKSLNRDNMEPFISYFKLNVKLPFLFSGSRKQYRLWRAWYPEANRYIMKNKCLPLRTRMVQYAASLNLFFVVRAYGEAVKLYYKISSRKQ